MKQNKVTNKTQAVFNHLQKYGSITSLEAIDLYGATRLSAIIYNLRKEHNISGDKVPCVDRFGNTTNFTRYTLND